MNSEIHERLMGCVTKVLGDSCPERDANLFEAGLHSIEVARELLASLADVFDVHVTLQELASHPTLGELEDFLASGGTPQASIRQGDYPLTQAQLGIMTEALAHPDSTAFNLSLLVRVAERVDANRLWRAVQTALAAHPAISATIHADADGHFLLRRDDAQPVPVELIETDALPEALVVPFDLVGGRLCRARVYVTSAGTYLFLDCHLVVCDECGMNVLVRDINAAYADRYVPLERMSAFELALEEDKLRAAGRMTEDAAYFDSLLGEADLDMLPDADVFGVPETSATMTLTSDLGWERIEAFLHERRLTADAFFNAAFAFVLSKLTGKSEALFATVLSGRDDAWLDRTAAMLVRTLPVLACIDDQQRSSDFIAGIDRQLLASSAHGLCPFSEVAKTHGIAADVLFCYQGTGLVVDTVAGEPAMRVACTRDGLATPPLQVEVYVRDGRVVFDCAWRCDLFSEDYVRLLVAYVERTARAFGEDVLVGEVNLLDEAITERMDAFNATEADYPVTDVVSLFRQAAQRHAGRPAVVFKDETLTYAEVDDVSERIAGYLRLHGVGHGDVVSVLISRSSYMVTASMGVLKSGAAYQPLDPGYPAERLSFMTKDANCKLLIVDEELLDRVPDYEGEVLLTKDIPALDDCAPISDNPAFEDLFILLYTSGSTGTPKGVMLEHGNLANFCAWYRDYFELDEDCRVAAYASYGFDACMMDLWPALTHGACVCIVEDEVRMDLMALEGWYNRRGITHAFVTTQVGRQLYTTVHFTTVRHLFVGGEKLVPVEPIEGAPAFYNGYGPTECTILSSIQRVDRLYGRVPIGRPLANYKLYVVDGHMRRLPPLAPGELVVAGRGVSRGYLNRPDQSKAAFVENPFSSEADYARAYRTGDVARLLPDGTVDIIGRRDGQVKVRGFRIELTEVEGVIREYPGIEDATVQAFEDEATGEKSICAYVVAADEVDVDKLNDFIRARKPPYMVPAVTMQIDAIPLNQNQKVNKRALPKPVARVLSKDERRRETAPLNMLEQEIADIVSEIIAVDDLGVTDRFSDLGLSSIAGIRLAVQLQKRFGVALDVRKLADGGTIQDVENAILSKLLEEDKSPAPVSEDEGHAPRSCRLSFAQQGVYAECQAHPESVQYNLPMVVTLPHGTGVDELEAAVRAVVAAHPYVLCHFVPNADAEIIQEPIADAALDIPVRDMSPEAFEVYKEAFVRPFDLARGPLVRFEIVRVDDALMLLADLHHLVSDGASIDLFLDQLCQALDGKELEPERMSYYDFVAREEITPEVEQFFATQMAKVDQPTELIPDVFEKDLPHTERIVSVDTDIQAVCAFARRVGVTPAAVYLAATEICYGRFVCEDTVAIATISNGRSDLTVSDTMGMFVNTLPLAVKIDHKEQVTSFLHRVAKDFADTIAHERYPFARIASTYDFHPQSSYTYQVGVLSDYRTSRGAVGVAYLASDIAKLPVGVYIEGTESEAKVSVYYDSALYSEQMMEGLARSVENVVRGLMVQDTLSGISLTDAEQWRVLDTYNQPWDLDFDHTDTVVSAFRRNARTQPDKEAAVFNDKRYTYAELDELTDALAAKLYARAAQITGKTTLAEEVVAILLGRNENVFILPLAALKAGLAYQPLDPSYPKERLNFMVADAGACLLVAEEGLVDRVDEYKGEVLTVEDLYAADEAPAVPCEPRPEDLFVLLYTSGSTGTPKGVMIEHRNLVAYAHGLRDVFCTHEDRTGAYASFGFDVNMQDVFCTLVNGGTVCLVPDEVRMNLGALASWFDEVGVTALLLTTQVGVQFAQSYPTLKTLRLLVVGGEKLPAIDPSKLSYTIANGYGPTENCCGVSVFPIKAWEPNIPIGRPFDTIHAYVLDRCGKRLPAGAAGEYCLSGPQVSRGYLGRPDKTAESYEPCPFNDFRMYHTGDIVRYRQNGDVEFVGRKDGQVKIRGFRVETKEVEAVIRGLAGIRDVTVQPYDADGGGKFLAAFVVADTKVDTAGVAEAIRAQKPAYMVPAIIMQIDSIPLTVNMKVDRKALPKPVYHKTDYVAPADKVEEDFCAIFAHALGIERMGAEDDFFEAGGSSILAMKVVVGATKAGYDIVYNDVFGYPSAKAMARHIEGAASQAVPVADDAADTVTEIPVVGRDGYDYEAIHELLRRNTIEAFLKGDRQPLGDVLLLGATGYLGCHVLHELIECDEHKVYCLVRPGGGKRGDERLRDLLRFYFGSDYAELFGSRLEVIEGDAVDPATLEGFTAPHEGMCAINCAASVKHFAPGNEIERTNVDSVRNIVRWCERNGARLVHISTGSIAGCRLAGLPPVSFRFDEHVLFAGQDIDSNQYIKSKFMAERFVFSEMLEHGLNAKVLRMGNLAPRDSDGRFQVNYRTNSYMNTFRAFATLGQIPFESLDQIVEFSPIDWLARAVLALSETPDACACFFPLNPHRPLMGDVMACLTEMGHPVRRVEGDAFAIVLDEALAHEETREAVSSLVAYNSSDGSQELGVDSCDVSLTTHILARLGLVWPETGTAYIRQFIGQLDALGFFGGDAK